MRPVRVHGRTMKSCTRSDGPSGQQGHIPACLVASGNESPSEKCVRVFMCACANARACVCVSVRARA
eukprot:4134645-Pleurochrysis_carterae.AAC.2